MVRLIKIVFWLGFLALLVFAGYLYGKRALDTYFNRGSVVTPSLVGKTLEEAVDSTNLPVRIASRVTSNDVPVGRIVAQDPPAGTPVHASKPILLVLSSGADLVDVPELVGQPLRKAKLALSDAKLGVGQLCTMTSDKVRDTVLAQYPASPSRLGKGGLVDMLLSAGPPAGPVLLPRVLGQAEAGARSLLEQAGFGKIDVVEKPTPPGGKAGIVLEQEPGPGCPAAPEGRVVLTVAREVAAVPSGAAKRFEFEFTMPPGLLPKRLEVYASEERQNRRVIYSREHQPGERVVIPVEGTGAIELEFYVDKVAFGREQF